MFCQSRYYSVKDNYRTHLKLKKKNSKVKCLPKGVGGFLVYMNLLCKVMVSYCTAISRKKISAESKQS